MPQMMPLSWMMLFLFFCVTFMMFNFMNYYSYTFYPSLKSKNNIDLNQMNWKW
uniref:ATP synthase complex subunit 8 n=1 Tax=Phyllodromica sp. Phil TaxID=2093477 RepID=A0A2P1H9L5_9NEOP|nr:ATP synthase F0 subunit 8 [Phyllodromica sp. Phil]